MPGVFAGASPLVLAPPNPPLWSSVLCAAALIAVFTSVEFLALGSAVQVLGRCPLPHSLLAPSRRFSPLPRGRLFHQASAWCLVEGLPLSFSSSVFITYFLSSSSLGLEFIADDPPALQQFNFALRRWCRHLLRWPSASPVAAVHWELGIGDVQHLALGRAFSLFARLCAVDHASPRPPVTSSVFRLSSSALGTWSHCCASALRPRHSTNGSPVKSILVFTRALRRRLSAMVSDLHGVLVDVSSDNFLPVAPTGSLRLPAVPHTLIPPSRAPTPPRTALLPVWPSQ